MATPNKSIHQFFMDFPASGILMIATPPRGHLLPAMGRIQTTIHPPPDDSGNRASQAFRPCIFLKSRRLVCFIFFLDD